jgi:hypothetical protein
MVETLTRPDTPDRPDRPARSGTRPWLRPFWRIVSAVAAVVLLTTGTVQAASFLGHEEETVVTTVPAEGLTTLVVDNSTGPVRVVGVREADEVRVTARVSRGWRRTGYGQLVEGDRLVLDATCPVFPSEFCRVRYTVEVPADMDVVVDADGWLRASGLDGDVDLSTDSGSIEVERLSGDVRMYSDAGRVRGERLTGSGVEAGSDAGSVRLSFDEAPDQVVADSDAGSVEVVVPYDGEPYRVTADSDAGSTTTDVDQARDATRSIVATSDAGSTTVRYAS